MTHTTLQKYTQHVTGRKDNHSELRKFKYKNNAHVQTSFSEVIFKNIFTLLILWPIEHLKRGRNVYHYFLNLTANHSPINTSHNNDTKIHYVGWENLRRFDVLRH